MNEDENNESVADIFLSLGSENSDPAPSQQDDAELPEERPLEDSESNDDTIIQDDESEDDGEAQETADDTEEDQTPQPKSFEIPLPDGTVKKVTAEEFNANYVPKSEFTRKTQEIADQKRVFEQESQQVRQQQIAVLQALTDKYQTTANPLVYMQQQLQEANEIGDVETVLRLRLDMQDEQKRQEQVANALAWEKAQNAQQQQAEEAQYIAEQSQKLREKVPFLSKPEGAEKFTKAVNKAMAKVGFSEAELAEMKRPDHRNAMLAYYAGKYLETFEAKPATANALRGKAVAPTPSARNGNAKTGLNAAMSNFDKNPKAEGSVAGIFATM